MSLHEEALSGRLTFEARPSWSGGVIDNDEDPLLGTTLHDTYVVSRIIGEGGMGRVYQAQHTRIASKRYAIKVLHSEFARNPEIRHRFQHEAEAAAKIEHPGVVGTYDIGETPDGGPYMVCEFLAGEDLNDYLTERGALPPHTVVHIGRQICSALSAAHARGVIHRDLKPHNVFVLGEQTPTSSHSETGDWPDLPSVKVLDFGLSRFIERDNDLTKTGIILGTPGYMAPEQAGGLPTDLRTDIYGIGALLYAAATGRAPFKEDTPQKTVLSVLSQVPARPRDLVPSIPLDLEIVIQRAMAREPNERYQSAEEVELALASLDAASLPKGYGVRRSSLDYSPRLQLLLAGIFGLALGTASFGLGLLAFLEMRGLDYRGFRPSRLEWALFGLLTLVALFPLGLVVRSFRRTVWKDSARVADLLPRVQRPLVAALLAYGVTALVALSAWGIAGVRTGELGTASSSTTLRWFVVLPLLSALAASTVAVWDAAKHAKSQFTRALVQVGYSTGAGALGVVLLILAVVGPSSLTEKSSPTDRITNLGSEESRSAAADAPSRSSEGTEGSDPGGEHPVREPADPPRVAADTELRERAPVAQLATAKSGGPETLEQLLLQYPRDGKILEALVLAHASRADTLDLAVKAISKLFEVEPEFTSDPDVLFILKKGLLAQGDPYASAFEVVRNRMGTEGGEVVFEMLTEHPKQQDRLKKVFFELRKAARVTPATAIAYDLRYEKSCHGRLALLERAETHGDARSVQQLQALSTAPKRCGWGRKCQPPCPIEAKRFRESIEVIQNRPTPE